MVEDCESSLGVFGAYPLRPPALIWFWKMFQICRKACKSFYNEKTIQRQGTREWVHNDSCNVDKKYKGKAKQPSKFFHEDKASLSHSYVHSQIWLITNTAPARTNESLSSIVDDAPQGNGRGRCRRRSPSLSSCSGWAAARSGWAAVGSGWAAVWSG